MGQTGPVASMAGYGYHAAGVAGFYELTGWADRPPVGPWQAYTDTVAPRFLTTTLIAALDHKRRTDEGRHIDLGQMEAALHFLAVCAIQLRTWGVWLVAGRKRRRHAVSRLRAAEVPGRARRGGDS